VLRIVTARNTICFIRRLDMYLKHFGLDQNPFSLTPDPRFLFLTAEHREALAALLFAVTERKGFMVMTGDAGTGKTTLIKKLLLSIPAACAQFSVVVNPALTRSEFLEYILLDFGEKKIPASKARRLSLFRSLLLKAHSEHKTSVLVVDEAHLLTADLIDEIRLLSNFETPEQKLLQIILAGQSELNTVLNLDSMRQVKQRIAVRTHLIPLRRAEISNYVQARWSRVPSQTQLPFSPEAIGLVAETSRGIPRIINAICDAALVNACGAGATVIDVPEIQEVLRDLALALPVLPQSVATVPEASVPRSGADGAPTPNGWSLPSLDRYVLRTERVSGFRKLATRLRVARSEAK
jgi:general secretion pathway protein A